MKMLIVTILAVSAVGVLTIPTTTPKHLSRSRDANVIASGNGNAKTTNEIISRAKRTSAQEASPYSAYRGRSSLNRYRYPLYKKRSNINLNPYLINEEDTSPYNYPNRYFQPEDFDTYRSEEQVPIEPYFHHRNPVDGVYYDGTYYESPLTLREDDPEEDDNYSNVKSKQYEQLRNLIEFLSEKQKIYEPFKNSAIMRKKWSPNNLTTQHLKKVNAVKNSTQVYKPKVNKTVNHPGKINLRDLDQSRLKRGFGDYSLLENEQEKKASSASQDDFDDFLTREYFKTIARSVGNKKKRMAFDHSESDKRASDRYADNLTNRNYVQRELKALQNEVASLLNSKTYQIQNGKVFQDDLAVLEALKTIQDYIRNLQQIRKNNAVTKSPIVSHGKSKRKSVLEDSVLPYVAEALKLPAECPVLDHLMSNCNKVSDIVGDDDNVFQDACLRHEVCYMCGSTVDVSSHECNAFLSTDLEATCASSSLECLSAAGKAYNILSKDSRYDSQDSCTYDPCVREMLQNR